MRAPAFILLFLLPFATTEDFPLKDGVPTSKGIRQYVEVMADSIIEEYEQFMNDTLYNVWIYADRISNYDGYDSMELGVYYPHEITITTAEMFQAYELGDLSQAERSAFLESNRFVKSTILHELTHEYIHQITLEMNYVDKIRVHRAFQIYIWILHTNETFGSIFIEEGICEYVTGKMGEIIPPSNPRVPSSIAELTDRSNRYHMVYKYASHFLQPYLDTLDFKTGVKILMANPPPTYEELLDPDRYFGRLEVPGVLLSKLKAHRPLERTNRVP